MKACLATLCLGLLVTAAAAAVVKQPPATVLMNFVTAKNGRLYDGAKELRYISVNMPDALQLITHYDFDGDYSATRFRLPDENETRDCIRTVRQLGGQVLRVFVITCRPYNDPNFMFNVATNPVIPNEAALRVIDRVLQVCHEEGVRVIIPLVAHNSPKIRGDWTTYGKDFWTVGSEANLKFKNMVTQLLGRTNHFTGVVYRDDPAILGWQTGNELVISNHVDRIKWLHDTAAFIKHLDPNHLVIDGRNRPWDVYENYEEFADDPNIDVVSYHTYADLPRTKSPTETLRLMNQYIHGRKVLLVTEISKNTPLPVLRELLDEVEAGGASGCNFWALRYHNRDGGFYKHSDKNSQFEDLNWPGFPASESYLPQIVHESALLNTFAEYGWRICGLARPPLPIPLPPELLPIRYPGHITWRGSTGARSYSIERATSPDGPWTNLAEAPDNMVVYAPQFCDSSAAPGSNYFYRVIAHNESGNSPPSAVVGPVAVTEKWIVDELFDLSQTDPASRNLRLERSYGHTDCLEDISVATRQDTNQPASLVYRLPGPVRSISATAYNAEKTPRLILIADDGSKRELDPELRVYDGGKRKRVRARSDSGESQTLEIVLPADSTTNVAIGRVEISFAQPAYREAPGLRHADGRPHQIAWPAANTGRSLNVTSYLKTTGGSLADNPARDDRPAIEAALREARPGDEVYLPAGVYNLTSAWSTSPRANLVLPAGISLRGQSRDGTILKSSFDDTGKDFRSVILVEGVSSLAISNLTVTSSWNRQYSDGGERNNPAAGGPGYAVAVGGDRTNSTASSSIVIENVLVEKFRRMGVRLGAGTHDVVVKNCRAQNATDLGGGGSGYGFVISGPGHTNATINPWLGSFRDTYWNMIDSCTTGPHIRHAVVIQFWAHNNLVTHNRFTSALDAIDLHGEDEYNNEVASNEVFDVAWQSAVGIGNNGATHDKSGPWNWVHANRITGCKSGITVEYGSEFQRIENNVIQGNTKYAGGYGIGLGNTKHTLVQHNIISSNTAPEYAAILIFTNRAQGDEPAGSPVGCTVTNNVLTGNTQGVVWSPSLPENVRIVNAIMSYPTGKDGAEK